MPNTDFTQDTPLSPEMQSRLNQPMNDTSGLDPEVKDFLHKTMKRVYAGEINVVVPSSLINQAAYAQLSEGTQGLADQKAIIFCSKLRDIKGLMDISGGDMLHTEPTYQVQQLVYELKMHKEEFEQQHGDVFVI